MGDFITCEGDTARAAHGRQGKGTEGRCRCGGPRLHHFGPIRMYHRRTFLFLEWARAPPWQLRAYGPPSGAVGLHNCKMLLRTINLLNVTPSLRWKPHKSHRKFHNFLQHDNLLLISLIFLVYLLKLWNSNTSDRKY